MAQATYTEEKEGFMIKILSTSVPDNQPLTSQETKAAVSFSISSTSALKVSALGLALRSYV